MRIIVFTKKYGYNFTGATVATHELARRFAAAPDVDRVDVAAKITGTYDPDDRIRVRCFGDADPAPLIRKLSGPDAVFYSDDHTGYLLARCGVPYVHTYHGNWPDARYLNPEFFLKSFYFMPLYARTIRGAVCVVNVSRYMKSFTDRYNKNSVVIRNGTAETQGPQTAGGGTAETQGPQTAGSGTAQKPPREGRCMMLGGVDERKYGKLPRLLSALDERKVRASIDIYGGIADKKLAARLAQSGRVTLRGYVDRASIDFSAYDLFLSTSTCENLPISIVEALKMKLPVIAADAGGIREAVNENCGRVIPGNRMDLMAEAVRRSLCGELSYNFDNPVLDEFSWDAAAEKYLRLFRKITGRERRNR